MMVSYILYITSVEDIYTRLNGYNFVEPDVCDDKKINKNTTAPIRFQAHPWRVSLLT